MISLEVLKLSLFSFLESHQVLAQLLDTLLAIGSKLPENQATQLRLVDVACKVRVQCSSFSNKEAARAL